MYGKILIPNIDYTISGSNISFTTAPRTKIPADDAGSTYIYYLSGFIENTIYGLDNLSGAFGENKSTFEVTRNSQRYAPIVDEYVIAIYDNNLLIPKVDYTFDGSRITLNFCPSYW